MKWAIIPLVVFASVSIVAAVPKLQAEKKADCSNASLQGGYGFLHGQTVVPAGTPFAALGRWNFDGKGKFTNTLTINDNGTVARIKDSGTYTVDTDCTGKIIILGGTGTIDIVLVDGGNEFYTLRADPNTEVGLFSANKKQFPDR